jgi:phosphotransferase system  glucose/maltose/N-acetylglucosamine-specific IIC component
MMQATLVMVRISIRSEVAAGIFTLHMQCLQMAGLHHHLNHSMLPESP